MIDCNRVTMRIQGSHCIYTVVTCVIRKLLYKSFGKVFVPRQRNIEGAKHPWRNLPCISSCSGNRQMIIHINGFRFLRGQVFLRWMKFLWLRINRVLLPLRAMHCPNLILTMIKSKNLLLSTRANLVVIHVMKTFWPNIVGRRMPWLWVHHPIRMFLNIWTSGGGQRVELTWHIRKQVFLTSGTPTCRCPTCRLRWECFDLSSVQRKKQSACHSVGFENHVDWCLTMCGLRCWYVSFVFGTLFSTWALSAFIHLWFACLFWIQKKKEDEIRCVNMEILLSH